MPKCGCALRWAWHLPSPVFGLTFPPTPSDGHFRAGTSHSEQTDCGQSRLAEAPGRGTPPCRLYSLEGDGRCSGRWEERPGASAQGLPPSHPSTPTHPPDPSRPPVPAAGLARGWASARPGPLPRWRYCHWYVSRGPRPPARAPLLKLKPREVTPALSFCLVRRAFFFWVRTGGLVRPVVTFQPGAKAAAAEVPPTTPSARGASRCPPTVVVLAAGHYIVADSMPFPPRPPRPVIR